MDGASRGRTSIRQWMIVIAVVAAALAVPAAVRDPVAARLLLGTIATVGLGLGFLLAVESFVGRPCPCCGRWSLARMARNRRYFRCRSCRARLRSEGLGRWADVSGPEDDHRFRSVTETRPWLGYARPADPGDTTSGRLLAQKRSTPVAPPPAPPPAPPRTARVDVAATLRHIVEAVRPSSKMP